jgi:hypothetical protein
MNKICFRYILAFLLAGTLHTVSASQKQEQPQPKTKKPALELSTTALTSCCKSMFEFLRAHPKLTGITCCAALVACPLTRNLIIKLVTKPFEIYHDRRIRSIEAETARLDQEAQGLRQDIDAEHESQATFLAPQLESIHTHAQQIEEHQWTAQDTIRMAQNHGKFDQAAQQATGAISGSIEVFNSFIEQTDGVTQGLQRVQLSTMQPWAQTAEALDRTYQGVQRASTSVRSIAENQQRIIQTLTQQ